MKAYISVQAFGDHAQKLGMCGVVERVTGLSAEVNWQGNVVFSCEVAQLGNVISALASDQTANWVEYTLQFDY